ncbi:MAG: hypothetical protein mread185_000276 [Mycoplasmataceae bacterium]|nr:MAG: hypothetical protein mread185_000276 [Mycoplasmataceae bacterium]
MLKETLLNNKQKPIILLDEFEKEKFTKITGTLTSNIRTRESSNTPYYAFFRSDDNSKHSLAKCIKSKCKDCEIPVIFRTQRTTTCQTPEPHQHQETGKPLLSKDDQIIIQGNWAKSDHSSRPSFTCYSYQLTNE